MERSSFSLNRRGLRSLPVLASLVVACGASQSQTTTEVPGITPPDEASSATKTNAPPPTTVKHVDKVEVSAATNAIVSADDRSEDDKKLDAGRHPGEMLAFFGIVGGMNVAEVMAGGGYTSELLARAVAPHGVVFAQNTKL